MDSALKPSISPTIINVLYPFATYFFLPLYFGRITIKGQENVPRSGPVIIAPTHRSRWDAVLVPYATGRLVSGRDLWFMVMSSQMQGFQGWLIQRIGGFAVDLKRPKAESFAISIELLSKGEMLTIFPEGGIFRSCPVKPLKPGVARIALNLAEHHPQPGVKILPITLQYNDPYPKWGTDVLINIGIPIDVANYETNSRKQAAKTLTHDLFVALNHLQDKSSYWMEEGVK